MRGSKKRGGAVAGSKNRRSVTNVPASSDQASTGAASALRGFRLQIQHAIELLLFENSIIRLEGIEDIDVLRDDNTTEILIQVKAHDQPLTLSNLSSKGGRTGFFQRLHAEANNSPRIQGRVVSFGLLGDELDRAQEPESGLVGKIDDLTVPGAGRDLLARTRFIKKSEADVAQRVTARLQELCPSATPQTSSILLGGWMLRRAEDRAIVTRDQLIRQLELAGRFATECRAHAEEWFRTIIPIQEPIAASPPSSQLAEEFYQGIGARREHVLADLDVLRPTLMQQISTAHERCNVVVLHGVSGAGKTTVLYRYAEEHRRQALCFSIDASVRGDGAPQISLALSAYAAATGAQLLLLIDVRPGDRTWTKILEQMASVANVKFLIAIREEDWIQNQHVAYRVRTHPISVVLTEQEASSVFQRLQGIKRSPQFLTFRDAWDSFGGDGPMLEFVHLVSQTIHLRSRLREQYGRLRDELGGGEMRFLHLAACGTAYAGRVSLSRLVRRCKLKQPSAMQLVERLEREYVLRRDSEGEWLEAVHPLRSRTLCDLAFDRVLNPIDRAFMDLVTLIDETDLEQLLLESFLRCSRRDFALDAAQREKWQSWPSLACLLRATVWFELSEYIEANRKLIDLGRQLCLGGWWLALPWRVSPLQNDQIEINAREMRRLTGGGSPKLAFVEALAAKIPELQYRRARRVFADAGTPVIEPRSISDWLFLAECLYWSRVLRSELPRHTFRHARQDLLPELPLQVQAQLASALPAVTRQHWQETAVRIIEHYQIVEVNDREDGTLSATFLISGREVEDLHNQGGGALNALVVRITTLLCALVPGRRGYGCEGVGWPRPEGPYHELLKSGMDPLLLQPHWQSRMLPVFLQLVRYQDYPTDWVAHADAVVAFRKNSLAILDASRRKIQHEPEWPGRWDPDEHEELMQAAAWIQHPPEAPQCVRTPWCIPNADSLYENGTGQKNESPGYGRETPGFFPREYEDYIERVRSAFASCAALTNALVPPSGSTLDWDAVERCAISAWNGLTELDQLDADAPYRQWWAESDLKSHLLVERRSLFEIMSYATLRRQGVAVGLIEAAKQVQDALARAMRQLTSGLSDLGIVASPPVDYGVPSFLMRVASRADANNAISRFNDEAWAVLRAEMALLYSVLQTFGSAIEVCIYREGYELLVFELNSLGCLVNSQEMFAATLAPGRVSAAGIRHGVDPVVCMPARSLVQHVGNLLLALRSLGDLERCNIKSWNRLIFSRYLDTIEGQLAEALAGIEASLADLDASVGVASSLEIDSLLACCRELNETNPLDVEDQPRWIAFVGRCQGLLQAL